MRRIKIGIAAAVVAAATLLPAAPAKAGTCTSDLPGGEAVCTVYFTAGYLQCKYLPKLGCLA
ncbi:MAG TPA: hypothetical protein VHJ76_03035 [Actinomycetota bacterium]|nr:hypothetical protein [Actinomycetota bacterium]